MSKAAIRYQNARRFHELINNAIHSKNDDVDLTEFEEQYKLGNVNDDIFNTDGMFRACCFRDMLKIAQCLHRVTGLDIHAMNDYPIRASCYGRSFRTARWLVSIGANIHAKDDDAFNGCCQHSLEMATWIHSFGGVNIRNNDDQAFRYSCDDNNVPVATWLRTLCDAYEFDVLNGKIVNYRIVENPPNTTLTDQRIEMIVI